MGDRMRPVWAEINLAALKRNFRRLRAKTPGVIIPIVKANAYGHGAVEVVRALWQEGARRFGVAFLEEALVLRAAFPEAWIMALGPTLPGQAAGFAEHNIVPEVFSYAQAEALSQEALRHGRDLVIHVKVDTGMGRIGFRETAVEEITRISRLPALKIEGLYTHLATADEEDNGYAEEQWSRFARIYAELKERGVEIPERHIANSAGILRWGHNADRACEYSRAGILLYGISPMPEGKYQEEFEPVLSWHTRIVSIKTIEAGQSVSYGRTFVAAADTRVAVLPLGYADGLRRDLSNRGHVLIRGRRAPVIGRICMDQTMIDVSAIPEATVGDEAVLIGEMDSEKLSVSDMAALCGTIPYEILCGISGRVPRRYVG